MKTGGLKNGLAGSDLSVCRHHRRRVHHRNDSSEGRMMTEMESTMYFYAFRYCLGRMTYCVGDFCEEATRRIKEIGIHELKLMEKEITDLNVTDTV